MDYAPTLGCRISTAYLPEKPPKKFRDVSDIRHVFDEILRIYRSFRYYFRCFGVVLKTGHQQNRQPRSKPLVLLSLMPLFLFARA